MTSQMLGELSRVFEAEARDAPVLRDRVDLSVIAQQLYEDAQEQRRQEVRTVWSQK